MHPQRHSPFETWQADVMRTLVDAGPLATSYFASTERHEESRRMAAQNQRHNSAAMEAEYGSPLEHVTQRGRALGQVIAAGFSVIRLRPFLRRTAPNAAAPTP